MRLSAVAIPMLPAAVERPGYDRDAQGVGIVHIGIGAFHRAHQAVYTDAAMRAGERGWMIAGVSLRSSAVAGQLNPQDGLYHVAETSARGTRYRLIGSVRRAIMARDARDDVIEAIGASATRIVSMTVTEKGYCRGVDGALDFALAGSDSIYPLLRDGLARRRDGHGRGLTLLSCDNLASNGAQLARLLGAYLDRHDPDLGRWVEAECTAPSTMVDRIVPATTQTDRVAFSEASGLIDEGLVVTEPFSQWIIEDRFATDRPQWQNVGAQLVANVAPYEAAKLRMLNGAHSAIAYLGLRRGFTFVHEAIADPAIRRVVIALMRDEAAPTVDAAPGQDLDAYAGALIARFENPALHHRLAQIAMDGSQKIPQRWLETIAEREARSLASPALLSALAAWLHHVRGDNGPVDDPVADKLQDAWKQCGRDHIVGAVLGEGGLVASPWQPTPETARAIAALL